MAKRKFYVEPHDDGGFGVKEAGAQRTTIRASTQQKAITEAREMYENATLHVARVRHIPGKPHPDKFRKIHI